MQAHRSILEQLYELIGEGYPVYAQDIAYGLRILERSPKARLKDIFLDTVYISAMKRRTSSRLHDASGSIRTSRPCSVILGEGVSV